MLRCSLGGFLDELLVLGRKLVPCSLAHHDHVGGMSMPRQGKVLLGLERLKDTMTLRGFSWPSMVPCWRAVRASVQAMGTAFAPRALKESIDGVLHEPNLQPLHVVRDSYGFFAVRQVAESPLAVCETLPAEGVHVGKHAPADFPVQNFVGLLRGCEKEGKVEHAELGHEVDDRAAGDDRRVHHAHAHALEKVPFVAELRVGVDGDRQFTLAPALHEFLEFEGTYVEGVVFVHHVGQLDVGGRCGRCRKNQEKKNYR